MEAAPYGTPWHSVPVSSLPLDQIFKLRSALKWAKASIDVVLRGGRCSFGFLADLADLDARGCVNGWSIIDTIARLEGDLTRSRAMKRPTAYERPVLRGLWHAHFFDARFLVENLRLENSQKRMRDALAPFFGQFVRDHAGVIAHQMTIGAFERRAQRKALTGECVVFECDPRGNYYLAVRRHKEDDYAVMERIAAYREFDATSQYMGRQTP